MKLLIENFNKYITEELESSSDNITIKFPKFRISEQWGKPGSQDRQIIEMFTSKIKGSTLAEKISSLNSFASECDEKCAAQKDVSEILANLVFLDSLSSIIYDFNDKSGGFLFESILAALIGGDAEQIDTKGGRDQEVTDIVDDQGRPISLKFFFSGASHYVGGSYYNLARDIANAGVPMTYIVAFKNRKSSSDNSVMSIDFYEFTVGYRDIQGDFSAEQLGGAVISQRGKFHDKGVHINLVKNKKFHLGNLNLGGSRENLHKIAQRYADRLGNVLLEIYDQIDKLSGNVNKYFLESPNSKDSALKARANAEALKKESEEL